MTGLVDVAGPSRDRTVVVALDPDDWRRWRAVRLAALAESPATFGSTLAGCTGPGDTEERWRSRWEGVPHNLVAVRDGTDVGVVGLSRPVSEAAPELLSMWVAPSARGTGVADVLVVALLAVAAEAYPGAPVVLSVYEDNVAARRLYVRHGFVDVGVSPDGPDERRMIRGVVAPPG